MRLLLIVNSTASSVTARSTVLIQQALGGNYDVVTVETNRRGHASRFAQDAAAKGVDVVVALGGDGTVNEVVNGLAGSETALAVLPGGSTNVFARTLGLPNDPVAATTVVVDALKLESLERVALGTVNGRYFCFHTGVGFDAAVVAEVERHAHLKRWLGHPLFVWAGLRTWLSRYDRRHPHFTVTFDDGEAITDAYFTIVLNTDPYTYLGNRPLHLSAAAGLERELVAITFRTLKARRVLAAVGRALRGKEVAPRHGRHRDDIDEHDDLRGVVISSDRPFPYQVDGDHLGDTRRLAFRHVPDALTLVVPTP